MCLSDGFTKEMDMQTPFSVKGWDWGHALTLTNYLFAFCPRKAGQ